MLHAARRALLIAAAIQPDSLEMVLTRLLVGASGYIHDGQVFDKGYA